MMPPQMGSNHPIVRKKTNSLAKKYQRRHATLILKQEKLSDLEVRIPKGSNEEVSVVEYLPIALRKGK